MRATFGVVLVTLVVGCGGVSTESPDAAGEAGTGGGQAGASAGTSGAAGTSSAGTSGAAGSSAGTSGAAGTGSAGAGGSVTGGAGAGAGSTGSAGVTGAAGTAGGAMCVHVGGPIVVTGLCPGKKACSQSCECTGGGGQACRSDNSQLAAQLPCGTPAEYIGDQPGATAHVPKYTTGFCNRAGTQCTDAPAMLCVSDCAACP